MHPNIISKGVRNTTSPFLIYTKTHRIFGITVSWGSTPSTVTITNKTDGTGVIIWQAKRAALATSGDVTQEFNFPDGMMWGLSEGAEISWTGTGVVVSVEFNEGTV